MNLSPRRSLLLAVLLWPGGAAAAETDEPRPPGAVAVLGSARFRHGDRVNCVAFAPDGKVLASGSHDHTVRFWDAATGRELRRLRGKGNFVPSLAYSRDGKLFAAELGDAAVVVCDAATGQEVRTFPGRFADFVTFSPDGRVLATVERDWAVHLRDVESGKELLKLPGGSGTRLSVAFSPDGKTLAAGLDTAVVALLDPATGKEQRALKGHTGTVDWLAFAPDGKCLASTGAAFDRGARLWDVETGKQVRHFKEHGLPVFSPDGKRLAVSGGANEALVWDLAKDRELCRLPRDASHYAAAAFSPDGKVLATANYDNDVRLWDVTTAKELFPRRGHAGGVTAVAFAPDGRTVASAGWDRTIRFWDVSAAREVGRIEGIVDEVVFLAFAADGKTLASESRRKDVRAWDVATRKQVTDRKAPATRDPARALARDGTASASASGFKITVLPEGVRNDALVIESNADASVNALDFSPDGRLLASGGSGFGGAVRLWEVATGQEVRALTGHPGHVRSVAFAPDGRRVVSGGADGLVIVWSAAPAGWDARRPRQDLDDRELERLWRALGGDGAESYAAVWELAEAGPKAAAFLKSRVTPAVDTAILIARLIAELDDDSFEVREKASQSLRQLGSAAAPALRKALEKGPSAEVRHRAEELLAEVASRKSSPARDQLRADQVRLLRALDVLERVGTKEAVAVLKAVAGGAAGAPETREAKAVLARLEKGSGQP